MTSSMSNEELHETRQAAIALMQVEGSHNTRAPPNTDKGGFMNMLTAAQGEESDGDASYKSSPTRSLFKDVDVNVRSQNKASDVTGSPRKKRKNNNHTGVSSSS